jgi:hypothetical protein
LALLAASNSAITSSLMLKLSCDISVITVGSVAASVSAKGASLGVELVAVGAAGTATQAADTSRTKLRQIDKRFIVFSPLYQLFV